MFDTSQYEATCIVPHESSLEVPSEEPWERDEKLGYSSRKASSLVDLDFSLACTYMEDASRQNKGQFTMCAPARLTRMGSLSPNPSWAARHCSGIYRRVACSDGWHQRPPPPPVSRSPFHAKLIAPRPWLAIHVASPGRPNHIQSTRTPLWMHVSKAATQLTVLQITSLTASAAAETPSAGSSGEIGMSKTDFTDNGI